MKARRLIDAAIEPPQYGKPEDVRIAKLDFYANVLDLSRQNPPHITQVKGPFTIHVWLEPGELERNYLKLQDQSYWDGTGNRRLWQAFENELPKDAHGLHALASDNFDVDLVVDKVTFVDYYSWPIDMQDVARKFMGHKLGESDDRHYARLTMTFEVKDPLNDRDEEGFGPFEVTCPLGPDEIASNYRLLSEPDWWGHRMGSGVWIAFKNQYPADAAKIKKILDGWEHELNLNTEVQKVEFVDSEGNLLDLRPILADFTRRKLDGTRSDPNLPKA